MTYTDNPITDLAEVVAHAQYVGFADIEYESRDWQAYRDSAGKEDRRIPRTRRPTTRDFTVIGMFPQTWGSTALGHGGIGGASVTTAYTIVLHCGYTSEYLVYFGGRMAYKLVKPNQRFWTDLTEQNLADRASSRRYVGPDGNITEFDE